MAIAFAVTTYCWLVFEVVLLIRDRVRNQGSTAGDRGTRQLNFLLIIVAVVVADVLRPLTSTHSPLRIPGGPGGWTVIAGTVIVWVGLFIRIWAVVTLGRSFRTTVEVDPGQTVVSSGPYRQVRHPSYTGLMLIVIGVGIASGNWLALAVCILLPGAAMVRRIRVEEAELTRVLGEPYQAYRNHTKRLIPGLW
jgi:protein-S-isoprenylcysteine O-methyltransferase Ste14